MEKKDYQLICSYYKRNYFISTAYRRASTPQEIWYFETIVWEWNEKTRKRGKMLDMLDSGLSEKRALINHYDIINKLTTPNKPLTNQPPTNN